MQRSLDGVSAFANAPCSSQSSPAVHDAVEAVKNIILPELPPLVPVATPKEPTVPINDETDEEVLQMLTTEWRKRLTKNEADSKAWEENLRVRFDALQHHCGVEVVAVWCAGGLGLSTWK